MNEGRAKKKLIFIHSYKLIFTLNPHRMHPLLDKDRFSPCEALIDELEECHKSPVFDRFFGKCSEIKTRLTKCLHEARLAHDRELILQRREKTKVFLKGKESRDAEEWGEDGYLKKVLELEIQNRQNKG